MIQLLASVCRMMVDISSTDAAEELIVGILCSRNRASVRRSS